jgi:hypothetical protein
MKKLVTSFALAIFASGAFAEDLKEGVKYEFSQGDTQLYVTFEGLDGLTAYVHTESGYLQAASSDDGAAVKADGEKAHKWNLQKNSNGWNIRHVDNEANVLCRVGYGPKGDGKATGAFKLRRNNAGGAGNVDQLWQMREEKAAVMQKAFGSKKLQTWGIGGENTSNDFLNQTEGKLSVGAGPLVLTVQKEGDVAILKTADGKFVTAGEEAVTLTDTEQPGSKWIVRLPLKTDAGDGWFSLESASGPGKFLRHYIRDLFAHKQAELSGDNATHFLADASWRFVDAE